MNHAGDVEEKAVILFDALKKTHGMKEKEKQLLQLAAALHDIGKFMNLNKHYIHSYNAIKASEILGLSEEELEIVANVARYHSSQPCPQQSHPITGTMRTVTGWSPQNWWPSSGLPMRWTEATGRKSKVCGLMQGQEMISGRIRGYPAGRVDL
jgi:hypothetical protein